MARQNVDIGIEGNDGTGDSIRESFRKVNENFQELYAVFGIGGQISFTDLNDTPDTYEGNENKVPLVKSDGSGLNLLELASDNSLDGTVDTIGFDFSVDGKLIIKQLVSKVSNDPEPQLGGPLNASTQPIANVTVNQAAIDTFNSVYGTDLSIGSLVIDKNYADRNYQAKDVAGGGIRLGDEPTTVSQYTLTATGTLQGNLIINGHGLTDAYNGAAYEFNSTGDDPFGVVSGGTYYIRIADQNHISLYETAEDVLNETGRILLSGGTGTFTIKDAAYDENLTGNWLNNVALPRKSIVRRQGDTMEGILHLSDHPGEVSGKGTPNGYDDLQAATKLYVDNVAAVSEVNLYVSTNGSDQQTFTPDGKEGRSPGYAFRTVNAAARKAEEVMIAAPIEPGPYMQTLTYGNGAGYSTIQTAGVTAPNQGRVNARALIIANKEFISKEVTGWVDANFPSFAGTYDIEICQRDVGYILEAVTLDSLLGDNANYLSRWSGIRYYSNVSAQKAIGVQRVETLAAINYAKTIVTQYILNNIAVPTTYQDRVEQVIDAVNYIPDGNAAAVIGAKMDIIVDVIENGVLDAPEIVDGTTSYKLHVGNNNLGFVDQANPENTDIIPGKVVRGKNSGATARIVDYRYEAGPRAVQYAGTDEIEVQLLEPIEFEPGEEVEYGNYVKETQISIRVESGIYEEDYPIRVPANVSVKGDEFRRVIIRPKKRVSQSRWANTFFYRDAEFDGLILGKSNITSIAFDPQTSASRTPGTYNVSLWNSDKLGKDAEFEVVVGSDGAVEEITVTNEGKDFQKGERITILDDQLGGGGANSISFTVESVPNGIEYVNPLTGEVDGYFGYHYLTKPDRLKNTGAGYENVGKWETNALTLIDNKEFIAEQVVNYVETTYPALVGSAGYSRTKCERDARLIVDALVQDFRNGGNEFSLEAQGEYYAGAVEAGTETETVAGIQHIYTVASSLIIGEEPATLYNPAGGSASDRLYAADLFNGSGEPADWTSSKIYRLGDVVKALDGLNVVYYTPTKEHTSGTTLTNAEISEFWREIDGPDTVLQNLINTVKFAFNADYNPPLRNEDMDVFLMNDATILRNMTVQGHGGFMLVLDPEGQVLTKSPYVQTGSSFSQSLNKQAFRGGLFVDAFVGNSAVQVVEKVDGSAFRLRIQSLGSPTEPQGLYVRRPETPCAFYVDGRRFQVNAVTSYNKEAGTAELILDPSSNDGDGFTGITSALATGVNLDTVGEFTFNEDKCARDTGYILDAVAYDLALGTNFGSVYNGIAYTRATGYTVQNEQKAETIAAIGVTRDAVGDLSTISGTYDATTDALFNEIIEILDLGTTSAATPGDGVVDALNFPVPSVLPTADADDAAVILQANRNFLAAEVVAWVNDTSPPPGYDQVKCERDVKYIVDALTYDVLYGGNTGTLIAARSYYDGAVAQLPVDQRVVTKLAYDHLASVVSDLLLGNAVTPTTGNALTQTPNVNNATATETAITNNLIGIIGATAENANLNAIPDTEYPDITWATAGLQSATNQIINSRRVIINTTVQSINAPLPITLQTAGNRSILGNDFTQVNDLGYGLVAANGALSEMVSMFTYYCHASYYSKNGAEIRSLTGSSCYGEYGLVAEGSDPNEIPDAIELYQDMTQPAKTFNVDVILETAGFLTLPAGEVVTQASTNASGELAVATSTVGGSNVLYLTNVSGAFDTTNELTGDVAGALGADSIPGVVDSNGYDNPVEALAVYVYDMQDAPSNRSEVNIWHPARPAFARYEVANVEIINHIINQYKLIDGSAIQTTTNPGATGFTFNVTKTINAGYEVEIVQAGTDYQIGDTFTLPGDQLGGAVGGVGVGNDLTIEVTLADGDGAITEFTVTGDIYVEATTPKYSGKVYKLNFSTSDTQFSANGLLEIVPFGENIVYYRNQTHIITDLARPDILTIRPSTALVFDENPGYVYRSISFLTSDSVGNALPANTSQAGLDSTYDFIRLQIDSAKAQEVIGNVTDGGVPLSGGTTKGGTPGDVVLAIARCDTNEIFRLNNNTRTPTANRPAGWTVDSLALEAPIITWAGKKHYVFNYRGVEGTTVVEPSEDNDYAIVDLVDYDSINQTPSTGLYEEVVLGGEVVVLRAGLKAGATGTVTVNISTCRATGHDFLDIGTGGFNASNYPNVIFGEPAEKDESNEVVEKGKGRVFYVSTDQNGIFRVGRFFSVDQGTGTVTFSASLALSDVDGLGFKRGVVITEFSTDTAMTDNASDTVPTESAVRGYVNRRLGYDVNGTPVANKLGPGVLAPNGAVPMTDDLNAAGNTITNLATPSSASDAATKEYVDEGRGEQDTLQDLRDIEYNNWDEDQLLVTTGYKILILDAGSIVGGGFYRGDVITGTITGATGTIVDVETGLVGLEGNIVKVTYTPTLGEFSDGKPVNGPAADVLTAPGGKQGAVVDGPVDEWANGVWHANSDIEVTTAREVTLVGSDVTDRYTTIDMQIKADTIVDADVNTNAAIVQSKLSLNAATTRVNATGITQNDLGVASFDDSKFAVTDGWVTIKSASFLISDIEQIATDTVLGRSDAGTGPVSQVSFNTVVDQGTGLLDADFDGANLIPDTSDPGEALIKTGAGTYGISNVTVEGEVNSIVKTDASGSIQANSLILGGDTSYEVLSLDSLTLNVKTPSQGLIFTAAGGANAGTPSATYPDMLVKGNMNIGGTSITESVLQNTSNFNGEKRLGVDWIYSSFIEAPGEKTAASTGLAIGANTGKTTAGQIAIVTADTGTSASVVPFLFSSSGVLPDTDSTYDIGSATRKYANVYADLFRGTATESYYADLAENYLGDADYEPGTVLVFGGDAEVTVTNKKGDHRVAGVVTTNPAHLMNGNLQGENVVGIALQGRVPCKVLGAVKKGDILVTSAIPGYAIVNNDPKPGTVIGKALENKTDDGKGIIEVVVGKH